MVYVNASQVCDYLLAFFLPPLGVFFKRGCSADLLINIGLTILGYIPGIAHAFWLIHTHKNSVTLA
ncbi:plasma membrane proteolipid Pmp3 [Geranomyces michiganensis]|nr:plasma membrane proteolipid Pmp3 [Geranomyces michiganensis]